MKPRNINMPSDLPAQEQYFAAVFDHVDGRVISIRADVEDILDMPNKGANPRICTVPGNIIHSGNAVAGYIREMDEQGRCIRL